MTPDLLNFKKGWMVLLDDSGQWKKYWFVLSTDRLRYYKDSVAEEASDLEGELDLSKCYNVSEYQVQRNYGFQIHTSTDVYTLSAMTSGIRKNWIQALMKNVHPANAPDVASSLPALHLSCSTSEVLPKPDLTQDSCSSNTASESKPRSVMERRREGRNKTFDWAELLPLKSSDSDSDSGKVLCSLELSDLERRKRREERRRRYETMLGFSLAWEVAGDPLKSKKQLEGEIELYWKQVETTLFRLERTVPLHATKHPDELEKMLDDYRTKVEDLKVQLVDSERRRLEVETLLSQQGLCEEQQRVSPQFPEPYSSPEDGVKVEYETPSIWLQDTDGNFQELREFLDDWTEADAPSPTVLSDDEEQTEDLNLQNKEDKALIILEKPAEEDCSDQTVLRRLAQEVELLNDQNEALNQRSQEMLNQLTEADREIERLKAELNGRYSEAHRHPETEKLESLEKELSLRDQQLLEAQALVASLEESLRDTEALVKESEPEKSLQKSEGYLLRCFEATEAKLTELERKLSQSELTCRELQEQNAELKEAEKVLSEKAAELSRMAEEESRTGEERTQEVMEGLMMRLKVQGELQEVMERLGLGVQERATEDGVIRQLRWEDELWSCLLDEVKAKAEDSEKVLGDITEQKMVEARMMLLGHDLLSGEDKLSGEEEAITHVKNALLKKVASSVSGREDLQLMAERLVLLSDHPCSALLQSAASEALLSCRVSRLQAEHQQALEETKTTSSFTCCHCGTLREENQQLQDRLKSLEEALKQTSIDKVTTASQTEGFEPPEEGELALMEVSVEDEQNHHLTREVDLLQQRLSVMEEQLTVHWEEKMRLALEQHQIEMENLKATCEAALTSLEDSHLKLVESLRRSHQQELERLLMEKDKQLEEEAAATATSIQAIQSAHSLELQKEVQRRQQSESSRGDAHLEEVYRQHSEELASDQRELEVLSQQYSLKCLENSHLGQALDAERKALCQCQQENQDLRTRNQELSSHLAAEITRLCSKAKQDDPALAERTDVYQMEITLRVKESEVQCLKQELASLKDDLQAAVQDRRNASKMYKDTYSELGVVRARAERDMEELRERLRLANQALTSP